MEWDLAEVAADLLAGSPSSAGLDGVKSGVTAERQAARRVVNGGEAAPIGLPLIFAEPEALVNTMECSWTHVAANPR